MNDALNIFIRDNRQAFDAAVPGAHGWTGVEKVLDRMPHSDELEQYLLLNRILLDTEEPADSVWTGISGHLDAYRSENGLERFIAENRDALDTELPDLRVWSEVAGSLPRKRAIRVSWSKYFLRAAASVALLVVGLGAGIWYGRSTSPGMDMKDVSPEYAELERYYERDITGKKEKLATFTGSQSADVMRDLDQLDQTMQELRRELASVPEGNRQQVVRAMIENYKSKTAILERVLDRLEENQNRGKNSKLSNEIKSM